MGTCCCKEETVVDSDQFVRTFDTLSASQLENMKEWQQKSNENIRRYGQPQLEPAKITPYYITADGKKKKVVHYEIVSQVPQSF